jgi:hypothetical protein
MIITRTLHILKESIRCEPKVSLSIVIDSKQKLSLYLNSISTEQNMNNKFIFDFVKAER